MPVGGKLLLKGGVPLKGVEKKKKKKKQEVVEEAALEDGQQQLVQGEEGAKEEGAKAGPSGLTTKKVDGSAISVSGKTYEQEFEFEAPRRQEGKTRSTPWGSTYRAAPEILHGYTTKVKGVNASERLDLRAAVKADKFCK